MKVVPYDPKYREAFIQMNEAWIQEMFVLEPEDIRVLGSFEHSLERGGQIFFAVDDRDEPLACCMISPLPNEEWEIEKFAARGMYTGTGAGSACLKACIDYAKSRRVEKIVVVSNRKCVHAVRLYRKFGFTEVPVDKAKFPFERADIAFELVLYDEKREEQTMKTTHFNSEDKPDRCVLIMNDSISGGYLANAIAVIALTVGERHPYLVGKPLIDANGVRHPGLIPIGIPMLQCDNEQLKEIRSKAIEKGFDVVDFPKQGQQTKNYDEFLEMMSTASTNELEYLGIAVIGKKNPVNKLTKHCAMIH